MSMVAGIFGESNTVSVLGREEGYKIKYGLSQSDFPMAQPEWFPEGAARVISRGRSQSDFPRVQPRNSFFSS